MRRIVIGFLLLLGFVGLASTASAAVVVGGSVLLDAPKANQLETWLGPNPITLTKIFSRAPNDGKSSLDFHAAADNQGATFSVIEAVVDGTPQIFGGYNPQSWNLSHSWNYTYTDVGRTAFLFNLTTLEVQMQKLTTDPNSSYGYYQTFNYAAYGPTFGAGHDLYINSDFTTGYAQNYSYGSGNLTDNIFQGVQRYTTFTPLRVEVFAVAQAATVPEPASLAIWTFLGLSLGGTHWWRRRSR